MLTPEKKMSGINGERKKDWKIITIEEKIVKLFN